MKESELQDKIAENLCLLENGLVLLEREFYLKAPEYGTRGYIDILAKDCQGRLVVIELKSRKSTTREAIHELFKYEEYLKRQFAVNSEEIRLCIIATDWRELVIPFSNAYEQTSSNLEAYHCQLNQDGTIHKIIKKELQKASKGRQFSESQLMIWCDDRSSAEKMSEGIQKHFASWHEKYIMIIARAPEGFVEKEKEIIDMAVRKLHIKNNLGTYKSPEYFICVVSLKEEREQLEQIVLQRPEALKAIYKDGYSSISEISDYYLTDKAFHHWIWNNAAPGTFIENSGPANLAERITAEGWNIVEIIRGANLGNSLLLPDERLLDEAMGKDGADNRYGSFSFSSDNRASVNKVNRMLQNWLDGKRYWRVPIVEELEKLTSSLFRFRGSISYYDPMSVLRYLYLFATDPSPRSFIPKIQCRYFCYNQETYDVNIVTVYGIYEKTHKSKPLEEVIQKYYGDKTVLLTTLPFDGYSERNLEIVYDLGFELSVYRETVTNPLARIRENGKVIRNPKFDSEAYYEKYDWNSGHYVSSSLIDDVINLSYPKFAIEEKEIIEQLISCYAGTDFMYTNY